MSRDERVDQFRSNPWRCQLGRGNPAFAAPHLGGAPLFCRIQLKVGARYGFSGLGINLFNPDLFKYGFPLNPLTGNDFESLYEFRLPIETLRLDQRAAVFRNP